MQPNFRPELSRFTAPAKPTWRPLGISRRSRFGLVAAVIALLGQRCPHSPSDHESFRRCPSPHRRDHAVHANLALVSDLINDFQARRNFRVDGKGLSVAVMDTGLRTTHVDFAGAGRIPAKQNFTTDNGGDPSDVSDGNGHGTNVSGIILAHDEHTGIAPGANVIPLKVLTNDGGGNFDAVDKALQWVIDNHDTFKISVVNLSLGDTSNRPNDDDLKTDSIRLKIKALRDVECRSRRCGRQRLVQIQRQQRQRQSGPAGHGLSGDHPRNRQRRRGL